MISNQEDFTIPIKDVSPKQLDVFFLEKILRKFQNH